MKLTARTLTQWALTLHIYLSMSGFVLILLFAVTGLTLNHSDFGWSEPRIDKRTLTVPPESLAHPDQEKLIGELRGAIGIRSPVSSYKEFPEEIEVVFAAPGLRTHVIVSRPDGTGVVESETRGVWGTLGDLHKGTASGRLWFWMIDIAAVLLTVSSITGIITLASLPARRRAGFVIGAFALVAFVIFYVVAVPK
jgi:hypothetical protein